MATKRYYFGVNWPKKELKDSYLVDKEDKEDIVEGWELVEWVREQVSIGTKDYPKGIDIEFEKFVNQ